MSRRHSTQSHRVQDLLKQVQETDADLWEQIYDIVEYDDGSIHDVLDDKWFDSLVEWAEYSVQLEDQEEDERNYSWRYDDE